MEKKLLIAVLGHRNSGKSETWKKLFNDLNIRTAQKSERKLCVGPKGEHTKVFLINGSPQERGKSVEEIIQVNHSPKIVLCSIQFKKDALNTLRYFQDHEYSIYLHWLNPGYKDPCEYADSENLIHEILNMKALVGKRDGKCNAEGRVNEIKNFIYSWSIINGCLEYKSIANELINK